MRTLYFLLGTIIPLPIFVNLLTGEFLVHLASPDVYLSSFGSPVPVGVFAFIFLAFLALGNFLFNQLQLEKVTPRLVGLLLIVAIFFLYANLSLGLLRALSLSFPFFIFSFAYLICQFPSLFRYSLRGFVISILIFVLTHAVSIITAQGAGIESKPLLFSSYYGYTIYQSLVSYSAVLSFLGCTLIVQIFMPVSTVRKALYLLFVVIIFFLLQYGARKAVLLDIFLLLCSYGLFSLLAIFCRFKVPRSHLQAIFSILLLFGLMLIFSGYAERDLTFEFALTQRGSAYAAFWELMINGSFANLLFGHGGGWGGYSNIFLEMFLRLGLVGLTLFLLPLVSLILYMLKTYSDRFFHQQLGLRRMTDVKVWQTFFVLSIVGSNSVNMNLQLPYYGLNMVFVSFAFAHFVETTTVKLRSRNPQAKAEIK